VVIDEDSVDIPLAAAYPEASPLARPVPSTPPARDTRAIGATLEDDDAPPKRRWRLFRKGGE
jgi:hypothetical protein